MIKNTILTAAFGVFALCGSAMAQVPFSLPKADHLKCFDIKDSLNLSAIVDLHSKQFGLEKDCKVGKAVQFCVPVTKKVLASNVNPLPIHTFGSPGDRICYRIECPEEPKQVLAVADQFGKRKILKEQARLLCTPALKIPVPPHCGLDNNGACNGPCPDTQECKAFNHDGALDCACVPTTPVPCGFDAAGQCGGDCPIDPANPITQQCSTFVNSDGTVGCGCVQPHPSCGFLAPHQCGGDCPDPNQVCVPDAADAGCFCQDAVQPTCGPGVNGQVCGGTCPTNQKCTTNAAGACGCA